MDKILLSNDDIEFILKWRDEHKDLVRLGASPLKEVKLCCTESGYNITAIRNGSILEFRITKYGKKIGKLTFSIRKDGMYALIEDKTKLSNEDRHSILTVYASTMALIVFGKATIEGAEEAREITARTPSKKTQNRKGTGRTYILQKQFENSGVSHNGTHKSPNCMFNVRGHFRHYKSGKIVWINEFVKGKGKEHKQETTYKVKPNNMQYGGQHG